MSDSESLVRLLDAKLPLLDALRSRLKSDGHAAVGELNIAHSSLSTVLEGLRQSGRPEGQEDFLKQGIKYLRQAGKTVDTLPADTDGLLKEVLAWQKAWNARPLPNEREAGALIRDSIARIAQKEALPKCRTIKDGALEELKKGFGAGWDFFDGNPAGALLIDGDKKSVALKSRRPELPKRLFAELNKELKKALGSPKGGAKTKTFAEGKFALQLDLSAMRAPGGVYPFDIHVLSVIVKKGTAELFGESARS